MLQIHDLSAGYTGDPVVRDISIDVDRGVVVSLIGANGAGKTTILKSVIGLVPLRSGRVTVDSRSIDKPAPVALLAGGVAMVPEGRGILAGLTVQENLLIGGYSIRNRSKLAERLTEVYELFPRLRERSDVGGGLLSGGEQQMLAIGRALMSSPSYLLLDEPSMGLSPLLVEFVAKLIAQLAQSGIGILLAEQNAQLALTVATRAHVLEQGAISLSGPGPDLLNNDRVRVAYLGMEA
ncbi:MAG: ABC transporter ATP-binding protein [Alphaproteobacteria bacterium]